MIKLHGHTMRHQTSEIIYWHYLNAFTDQNLHVDVFKTHKAPINPIGVSVHVHYLGQSCDQRVFVDFIA